MISHSKKYYAKVLLFGEYTVINGSDALAIPCSLFSGHWGFDAQKAKSQSILYNLHDYLANLEFFKVSFQSNIFKEALDQHLVFDANIPIGYGVGSSGAVCAAIFDRFFKKEEVLELNQLKTILAKMESFFHGSSSGLDPLVSYLQQAVLSRDGLLQTDHIPPNKTTDYQLFLLDTGYSRRTAPLVELYLEKWNSDKRFQEAVEQNLSGFNNQAINCIKNEKLQTLFSIFHKISHFQFNNFEKMILDGWKAYWQEGLESDWYKLKLCGAGGGGFVLGMTKDWNQLEKRFSNKKIPLYKIY